MSAAFLKSGRKDPKSRIYGARFLNTRPERTEQAVSIPERPGSSTQTAAISLSDLPTTEGSGVIQKQGQKHEAKTENGQQQEPQTCLRPTAARGEP